MNYFGRAIRLILCFPVFIAVIVALWTLSIFVFIGMSFYFIIGSMFGVTEQVFNDVTGPGAHHISEIIGDLAELILGKGEYNAIKKM